MAPCSVATTRPTALADASAGDFLIGSADEGVHVARGADGAVLLAPILSAEFTESELPPGWFLDRLTPDGTLS